MVLGELELCLQSTLLHHVAEHHQAEDRRPFLPEGGHWRMQKLHVTSISVAP